MRRKVWERESLGDREEKSRVSCDRKANVFARNSRILAGNTGHTQAARLCSMTQWPCVIKDTLWHTGLYGNLARFTFSSYARRERTAAVQPETRRILQTLFLTRDRLEAFYLSSSSLSLFVATHLATRWTHLKIWKFWNTTVIRVWASWTNWPDFFIFFIYFFNFTASDITIDIRFSRCKWLVFVNLFIVRG